MIILTKLKGGLGNQLFQYATGRLLSNKTDRELFLDVTGFSAPVSNTDTVRQFDLEKFNINAKILPPEEVQKIKNPYGIISKGIRYFKHKVLNLHYYDFEPLFFESAQKRISKNKNIYIEGYFQSEKNFLGIREILLQELSLKEEFKSKEFIRLQSEIESKNSVSVHIRRGDYIKNPGVTKYHGICSLKYYQNAINKVKESVVNPVFYFFSDDPVWVSENVDLNENSKIISDKNLSAPEELILMSTCKHNIISNSTFSWWGAWLNKNYDKLVIAPTPWVEKSPSPHKNIISETWIQLPKNH